METENSSTPAGLEATIFNFHENWEALLLKAIEF